MATRQMLIGTIFNPPLEGACIDLNGSNEGMGRDAEITVSISTIWSISTWSKLSATPGDDELFHIGRFQPQRIRIFLDNTGGSDFDIVFTASDTDGPPNVFKQFRLDGNSWWTDIGADPGQGWVHTVMTMGSGDVP